MLQIRPWKIFLIIFALSFGVIFTLPNVLPRQITDKLPFGISLPKLNLGLDLQGGSYLLLEVDIPSLKVETYNNLTEDIRQSLTAADIGFSGLTIDKDGIALHITDPKNLDKAFEAISKFATPLPGGSSEIVTTKQGTQDLRLSIPPQAERIIADRAVEQSIEIIRKRIDQLGTREPSITRNGTTRIVIEAPGESDPERLKSVIGKTAKLTFHLVDEGASLQDAKAGRVSPEDMWLKSDDPSDQDGLVLKRRADISGDMLTEARPAFDQEGRPSISFRMNARGSDLFSQLTSENIGKRFAIVLDDKIISAPVIRSAINGSGEISGNFTQESANDLANLLRSGALPARLLVQEQRTVGAELGADSIRAGETSLIIGTCAIFIFIILAYGLFGIFAALALIVNGLLIVALLSLTQATLTLPGIAGLILTLAVAVDANVLIYERMREEARSGKKAILAADAGFRRAWITIFDANATTVIAAFIMFSFGTGTVKGFAWTLGLGVFTSVFTSVFVTQLLLGLWFRYKKPKVLPIV